MPKVGMIPLSAVLVCRDASRHFVDLAANSEASSFATSETDRQPWPSFAPVTGLMSIVSTKHWTVWYVMS